MKTFKEIYNSDTGFRNIYYKFEMMQKNASICSDCAEILRKRGVDEGLIKELEHASMELDVQAIQRVSQLSDEELNEFTDLWGELKAQRSKRLTLEEYVQLHVKEKPNDNT